MPDLVILAANVRVGAGANRIFKSGIVSEAVDAGEVVQLDSATNQFKLAVNDTAANAEVKGFALNSAEIGQPIDILEEGEISLGVGVQAVAYFLSPNAGKIAPEADVLTGDFKTLVGIAKLSNRMQVKPVISGAQVP